MVAGGYIPAGLLRDIFSRGCHGNGVYNNIADEN